MKIKITNVKNRIKNNTFHFKAEVEIRSDDNITVLYKQDIEHIEDMTGSWKQKLRQSIDNQVKNSKAEYVGKDTDSQIANALLAIEAKYSD